MLAMCLEYVKLLIRRRVIDTDLVISKSASMIMDYTLLRFYIKSKLFDKLDPQS